MPRIPLSRLIPRSYLFLVLLMPAGDCLAGQRTSDPLCCLEAGLGAVGIDPARLRPVFSGSRSGPPAGMSLSEAVTLFAGSEASLGSFDSPEEFLQWSPAGNPLPAYQWPGMLPGAVPGEVSDTLEKLLPGAGPVPGILAEAGHIFRLAFRALTPAEIHELHTLARGFPLHCDQWPDYPADRLVVLAAKVDLTAILRAALITGEAASILRTAAERLQQAGWKDDAAGMLNIRTEWGQVIVGSGADDEYNGELPFLLIDPGGNDTYCFSGGRGWPLVSLVMDMSGDDRYIGGDFSAGGAIAGICRLEELGGNDTYDGGGYSQGAAVLGAGICSDYGGNDSYRCDGPGQGVCFYGLGLLFDRSGNDTYEVTFMGQGACAAGGLGVLAELGGNDTYVSGGKFPDWREPGATKSYSQGTALGLRPLARGGAALLYDREGSDSYRGGYLCQGAGYWGGTGLLLDGGGGDRYVAQRYAQGCGLHFATGCLVDAGGGDIYELGGVGQGAGEDRALGLLLETAGDDSYSAGWMARGAAGAAGVGLLLELGGDDAFQRAAKASDGYGSRVWEMSGLGFLIDCAGAENHSGSGSDGTITRNGTWGAHVDLPLDH